MGICNLSVSQNAQSQVDRAICSSSKELFFLSFGSIFQLPSHLENEVLGFNALKITVNIF